MEAIKLCRLDTPIIFIEALINLSRFVVTGCAAKTSATVTFPSLNLFFFSGRRRHTRLVSDWSSDVCSSDLEHDVTALRAKGDLDRVGQDVHAALERAARILVELQLLVSHVFSLPPVLPRTLRRRARGRPRPWPGRRSRAGSEPRRCRP